MKDGKIGLAILCVVIGLVVGGALIYGFFPRVETETKTIEVPVTVTQEVVKEVIRDYRQLVVDELLVQVGEDKDYRVCQSRSYDADEITLKKVYNGFVYTMLSNGDEKITNVKISLDYDEGNCAKTFTCNLDENNKLSC